MARLGSCSTCSLDAETSGCINTVIHSTVLTGFAASKRLDKASFVYQEGCNVSLSLDQSRCGVQGDPACSQYPHPSLGQLRQMPEPTEGAESATAPGAVGQVSFLCFALF